MLRLTGVTHTASPSLSQLDTETTHTPLAGYQQDDTSNPQSLDSFLLLNLGHSGGHEGWTVSASSSQSSVRGLCPQLPAMASHPRWSRAGGACGTPGPASVWSLQTTLLLTTTLQFPATDRAFSPESGMESCLGMNLLPQPRLCETGLLGGGGDPQGATEALLGD